MKKKYSDEFKLMVINDYYNSPLGVRAITNKYKLPSKNYIPRWEEQLKRKGILPPDAAKPNKAAGRSKDSVVYEDTRTPREKEYEARIQVLEAKIAYFESLEYLKPFIKKVKTHEIKYKAIMNIELHYPEQDKRTVPNLSTSKGSLQTVPKITEIKNGLHKKIYVNHQCNSNINCSYNRFT